MPSAEAKLHAAWPHIEHAHKDHTPAQVLGVRNSVPHLEKPGARIAIEPEYQVKCSCGEVISIPLQDVVEHTDAPEKPQPEGASGK